MTALDPRRLARCHGRLAARGGAFVQAADTLPCGFVAAADPAAQAVAQSRRTHRHSGSLQLGGQLAAAPAFAMQREQFFAQRVKQVFGGPPFFRRLAFRQLGQLFVERRVIQLRGDLRVINACAHTTSLHFLFRLAFGFLSSSLCAWRRARQRIGVQRHAARLKAG